MDRRISTIAALLVTVALFSGAVGCSGSNPSAGSGEVQQQQGKPVGLADEVRAQAEKSIERGSAGSEALKRIDEYQNLAADSIVAVVDEQLDSGERATLAQAVFDDAARGNAALSTVVIRDSTGVESEHPR